MKPWTITPKFIPLGNLSVSASELFHPRQEGARAYSCCHWLTKDTSRGCESFGTLAWHVAHRHHTPNKDIMQRSKDWRGRPSGAGRRLGRQNGRGEHGPRGSVFTTKTITLASLLCVCAWHIFASNFSFELPECLYFSHVLERSGTWILLS